MRKIFSLFSVSILISLILSVPVAAATKVVDIALNNAYAKGKSGYDVVVQETPGAKLALYVNDKNPVRATVNSKSWATFHKVKLTGNDKLSFTTQQKDSNRKTHERAINYVRYYQVNNGKVQFSKANAKPAATPAAAPAPTPAPAVAPVAPAPKPVAPAPAPEPVCTNGSYVNTAGNRVCSPAASSSVPAGATAQCQDGTYSFSQSRRGTCSHHGGVATWL
jgi:hypothetical protein